MLYSPVRLWPLCFSISHRVIGTEILPSYIYIDTERMTAGNVVRVATKQVSVSKEIFYGMGLGLIVSIN